MIRPAPRSTLFRCTTLFRSKGHTSEVLSVVFSLDGKRLASASHDLTVKVWNAQSGLETLTLREHDGRGASVGFSPDAHGLASGSWDRTAKVWDTSTGLDMLT